MSAATIAGRPYLEVAAEEDALVLITCGHCLRASGYDRWCRTVLFGELPPDEFQCPKCGKAFERRRSGRAYPYPAVELVPISSRL